MNELAAPEGFELSESRETNRNPPVDGFREGFSLIWDKVGGTASIYAEAEIYDSAESAADEFAANRSRSLAGDPNYATFDLPEGSLGEQAIGKRTFEGEVYQVVFQRMNVLGFIGVAPGDGTPYEETVNDIAADLDARIKQATAE
jgi:hypothetical protein